jgi:hypothetical protein
VSLALKRYSALPGFGVALGFTLVYLSRKRYTRLA